MSKVKLHYRHLDRDWREVEIEVKRRDHEYTMEYYDVILDGDHIGVYQRIPNHRTHQVHGRIRYDNKPRTRFQRVQETFDSPRYFTEDTRVEVLADIITEHFDLPLWKSDWHASGRKPMWVGCDLHE